jgi:competence protein ComEA
MPDSPTNPGQTPASFPPSDKSRFSKFISFIARPLFVFCVIAIVVGSGTLVSNLTAVSKSKVAALPTGESGKPGSTTKAGLAVSTPHQPSPTPDRIIKVFITGEVARPGVYEMRDGDRIIDAVKVAGGFTGEADKDRIDQALRVRDEMRIEIPRRYPSPLPGASPDVTQASPVQAVSAPSTAAVGTSINVNTASAADLDKLPGIGEVLSQRIVDYRTKNGPFRALDDLRKVTGLNNSIIEKIKDLITF